MPISVNSLFFILFSSFIFLGALFSIVSKNMIYTLLSAIIVFLGVGGIFALLGAIYNAVVQLLVYVLVIPILIAVSIMFIKPVTDRKRLLKNKFWLFLSEEFYKINQCNFSGFGCCRQTFNKACSDRRIS